MANKKKKQKKIIDHEWRVQLDVGIDRMPYGGSIKFDQTNFYRSQVDEIVIDGWFHLEAMDDEEWYLRIGDKRYNVYRVDGETVMSDADGDLPPIKTISKSEINERIDTIRMTTQMFMSLVADDDPDKWESWLKDNFQLTHDRLEGLYWLRGDPVDPDADQ